MLSRRDREKKRRGGGFVVRKENGKELRVNPTLPCPNLSQNVKEGKSKRRISPKKTLNDLNGYI